VRPVFIPHCQGAAGVRQAPLFNAFALQIVFNPKRIYHTDTTTLARSPGDFPRTAVGLDMCACLNHEHDSKWIFTQIPMIDSLLDTIVENMKIIL
jgi:hypothetical protein